MKRTLTIIIGFIHDFAGGCWAATVLAVYRLDKVILEPQSQAAVRSLQNELFYIGIACTLFVFGAGAGRTFTYVQNVYGEDAERSRRKLLMAKHVILIVTFGLGTYWQYTMIHH